MVEEPPLRDTKPRCGGIRCEQLVGFGIRTLVRRPGLGQGLVQDRVYVGGEVTDLTAEIHDDRQGQAGQDG